MTFVGDSNGNMLFWRTTRDPDDWTLVYSSIEFTEQEEYDMTLTEWLCSWLTGQVRSVLAGPAGEWRFEYLQKGMEIVRPFRY